MLNLLDDTQEVLFSGPSQIGRDLLNLTIAPDSQIPRWKHGQTNFIEPDGERQQARHHTSDLVRPLDEPLHNVTMHQNTLQRHRISTSYISDKPEYNTSSIVDGSIISTGDLLAPGLTMAQDGFAWLGVDRLPQAENSAAVDKSLEEEYGDFVEEDQDFDDFGDFIDSTEITNQDVVMEIHTASNWAAEELLEFLQNSVMLLPTDFLSSLASAPFPVKQRVLSHDKTKTYLAAMAESASVAQRVITGWNSHPHSDTHDRAKFHAAAGSIAQHWQTLSPRLTSLSGGSIRLPPIHTGQRSVIHVQDVACDACRTTENAAEFSRREIGQGHVSCLRVLERFLETHKDRKHDEQIRRPIA